MGKSRFMVASTQNSLILYYYLLIIVLFPIRTTVNLLLPYPVCWLKTKLLKQKMTEETKLNPLTPFIFFVKTWKFSLTLIKKDSEIIWYPPSPSAQVITT